MILLLLAVTSFLTSCGVVSGRRAYAAIGTISVDPDGMFSVSTVSCYHDSGLQIRRSNKDNLGIIIRISSEKHIL